MRTSSGRYSVVLIRTIEKSYPILSITYQGEGDRRHNGQMHACPKNCRDGGSDPARAEGQGRLSKRFLRFAHPWWDLRIGMRCFSNPRRRDSFRDRNCRMGPLLRLSFSDRFPRILQLPAFGNPARSGGSQNTPRKFRVRRLKGNDSCCFSLESVHAVLSFEKLYPGDGEQAALDVKTY